MFNNFRGSYKVNDDYDSSDGNCDYDNGYDNVDMRFA